MAALVAVAVNIVCLLVLIRHINTCENQKEEGQDSDYLQYLDERGDMHYMNISTMPDPKSWHRGNISYLLYTRNNPLDPEELHIPKNNSDMESQYFNATNDIKAITHGWMSSAQSSWLLVLKDFYLQKYDTNVILVDWSSLAKNPIYPWSAAATRYVGKRVSKLLESLVQSYEIKGDDMHLVGHSLGAQVMGFAGMFYNDVVNRVTGLDPARPLFEFPPMLDDCRLSSDDARFVDIIHSCGGIYGYLESHGDADYYPNGGKSPQPGCGGSTPNPASCSHGRAVEFFMESVHDPNFTSYPCESYEEFENGNCRVNTSSMGESASDKSHGDYYLHTRSESPYAAGDEFDDTEEQNETDEEDES